MQDRLECAVLLRGHQDAVLVARGAKAAKRHGEPALDGGPPPAVRLADDPDKLLLGDVADPADLRGVAVLRNPVDHLPDVAHLTAGEAELRDVDDRLVAELQRGQVAYPAPHLGAEFTAPHDGGAPRVPCRLCHELGDGARPCFRVAERVASCEHHAGHYAVADARLAGRRPDHALVVAQGEVAEGVPVAVLVEQSADLGGVGRREVGAGPRRAEKHVDGGDQRERAEHAGQDVVQVTALIRCPPDGAVDADEFVQHVLHPLGEGVTPGERPDRQIAEADREVHDDKAHENPRRGPPGARVPDSVEVAMPVEEDGEQDDRHHAGGGDRDDEVRETREVDEVDDDVEHEQSDNRLPRAPLPPSQPAREHQEHQADDDVRGAGDVRERPGHDGIDPAQPLVPIRLKDGEYVGEANEEGKKRGNGGNPRQPLSILALP